MGDLLKRGAQWLSGQKSDHCSQTVTYSRGNVSFSPPAELGSAELNLIGTDGQPQIEIFDQAFLINISYFTASDLTPAEPKRGDRIVHAGQTFEVNVPGGGKQAFLHDNHHTRFKVFCKRISR